MKFDRIYVEITSACNLNCSFCYGRKRKKEFMTTENFSVILDKISPFTKEIYLHVLGEPLLHKNFLDFIMMAKEKSIKINLTTNGMYLKQNLEKIIESGAVKQINISVQAIIEKEEKVDEILECAQILSKSKIVCTLRFWTIKSVNKNLINKLQKISEIKLNKADFYGQVKIAPYLFLGFQNEFLWPSDARNTVQTDGFCNGLRTHIAILVNGTVVPCCLDCEGEINLGNIFTDNLNEILFSERAQNIYKGFSSRKAIEKLCKKCSYKNSK